MGTEIEFKRLGRDDASAFAHIAHGVFDAPIQWERACEFLDAVMFTFYLDAGGEQRLEIGG